MAAEGNLKFFNDLAGMDSYLDSARMFSFDRKVFDRTFSDVRKKLKLAPADSVCDLGGGTGHLTRFLAESCRKVVLADGAEDAIQSARKRLARYSSVSYRVVDISRLPLPFSDAEFEKVLCYSVVHYLSNHEEFSRLFRELLRITKPGGRILIGDIPLSEKYAENMRRRKIVPVKNFFLNLKYYFKKYFTFFLYRIKRVDTRAVKGLSYTKERIAQILSGVPGFSFSFLEQDSRLPSADSREDLLVIKNH